MRSLARRTCDDRSPTPSQRYRLSDSCYQTPTHHHLHQHLQQVSIVLLTNPRQKLTHLSLRSLKSRHAFPNSLLHFFFRFSPTQQ